MARSPSRESWHQPGPSTGDDTHSTLEGLGASKPKRSPLAPRRPAPLHATARTVAPTSAQPHSPRVLKAIGDVTRLLRALPKRHDLDDAEISAFWNALTEFGEDCLYDDDGAADEDINDDEVAPVPQADTVQLAPPLPADAPALWKTRDLNLRENAPRFIRRVYAPWLGRGLERKDLVRLDPDLYKALSVWLSRHPDDPIATDLPAQREKLDELIDRLSTEYSLEDLRKLGYAIDSRLRRNAAKSEAT